MTVFPDSYFSEIPRADLTVLPPAVPPLPGEQLRGYLIYEAPSSCFVRPHLDRLSGLGWVSIVVLSFLFWPVACIPCCLGGCYDGYQIPVYR